jgi:hypothetical protein
MKTVDLIRDQVSALCFNMPSLPMDEWADCLTSIVELQKKVSLFMNSAINAAQTEVANRIDTLRTRRDIDHMIEYNSSIIISSSSVHAKSNWDLIAKILNSHTDYGNIEVLSYACSVIEHQVAISEVEVVRSVDIGSVDVALLTIIEKFDNANLHADLIEQALRALSFLYSSSSSSSSSNAFAEISDGVWIKLFATSSEDMFLNAMKLLNSYFAPKKRYSKIKIDSYNRMQPLSVDLGSKVAISMLRKKVESLLNGNIPTAFVQFKLRLFY